MAAILSARIGRCRAQRRQVHAPRQPPNDPRLERAPRFCPLPRGARHVGRPGELPRRRGRDSNVGDTRERSVWNLFSAPRDWSVWQLLSDPSARHIRCDRDGRTDREPALARPLHRPPPLRAYGRPPRALCRSILPRPRPAPPKPVHVLERRRARWPRGAQYPMPRSGLFARAAARALKIDGGGLYL